MKSVRLDDARITELLDRCDERGDHGAEDHSNRRADRFVYRPRGIKVAFQQPGGNVSDVVAPARNISSTGIAILHGGYVYPGIPCDVQLLSTRNMWQQVSGKVARCVYLDAGVHEVGIQFDREIDVALFSKEAVTRRILVIDDDALVLRLVMFHLSSLKGIVDTADSGGEGIEKAAAHRYDCILLELDLGDQHGLDVLKQIRATGYSGKIAAMTSHTGPDNEQKCFKEGFDLFVPKPISRTGLSNLLEGIDEEPLYSSLAGDPTMNELIRGFVASLKDTCKRIEQSFADRNLADLEKLARRLKGDAGSYGFEPVTEAAAKLEKAAKHGEAWERIASHVSELTGLSALARAPEEVGAGKE